MAEPNRPNRNPPNNLHFADDPYGQEAFLPGPPFECWVTSYSHDSHPPIDENHANEYEYAPEASYEDNNNQDYDYFGEEKERPNKLYHHPPRNTFRSQFLRLRKCTIPHTIKPLFYACLIQEQLGVGFRDQNFHPTFVLTMWLLLQIKLWQVTT